MLAHKHSGTSLAEKTISPCANPTASDRSRNLDLRNVYIEAHLRAKTLSPKLYAPINAKSRVLRLRPPAKIIVMKPIQVLVLALCTCVVAMPAASPKGTIPKKSPDTAHAHKAQAVMSRDVDDEIVYPDEKFYAEEYKRCQSTPIFQRRTTSAKLTPSKLRMMRMRMRIRSLMWRSIESISPSVELLR